MLPIAVSEHYRAQQRLIVATLGLTRREWAKMGPDFDASWARVGPRVFLLTASAQLGAARQGARYVPVALRQQGIQAEATAEVDVSRFAGVASDGRQLESLLYGAVVRAKEAMQIDVRIDGFRADVYGGASAEEALASGGRALDMYVHTQIADAARSAAGVAIAATPRVGWVRMVNPPCCPRCAVQAGKVFKWNQGFQRHPRCDCAHVPTTEQAPRYLSETPSVDQIKGLTVAQRKALNDGADLGQVVNAQRGASGMTTTAGATRKGLAGSRLQGRRRLTPDGIYRIASDRTEALTLLKQHGYVI